MSHLWWHFTNSFICSESFKTSHHFPVGTDYNDNIPLEMQCPKMALRCHWGLICVQRKWDNFFSNSELFTLIYMPMIAASCPTITQHDVLYITVILVSKNRKVFFLPPKYALFLKSCLCSCVVTVCTCVRVF